MPAWLLRSIPVDGSSRMMRSGLPMRARAMDTRCACPPDNLLIRRSLNSVILVSSNTRSTSCLSLILSNLR